MSGWGFKTVSLRPRKPLLSTFPELSAKELTTAIRRREISAREALEAHFERIDAINSSINAVVTEDRDGAEDDDHGDASARVTAGD